MIKLNTKAALIIGGVLAVLAIGFFLGRSTVKRDVKEIPIRVEVPVPVVESDTIWRDSLVPVKVETPNPVNTKLVSQYDSLKTEIEKRDLYLETIKKRTYKETFEDSIQTIEVTAVTTGFLDSLGLNYKTKPRHILLDTVVKVKMKEPMMLIPYVSTDLPGPNGTVNPSVGLDYVSRKGFTVGLGYDSRKNFLIKAGYAIKF